VSTPVARSGDHAAMEPDPRIELVLGQDRAPPTAKRHSREGLVDRVAPPHLEVQPARCQRLTNAGIGPRPNMPGLDCRDCRMRRAAPSVRPTWLGIRPARQRSSRPAPMLSQARGRPCDRSQSREAGREFKPSVSGSCRGSRRLVRRAKASTPFFAANTIAHVSSANLPALCAALMKQRCELRRKRSCAARAEMGLSMIRSSGDACASRKLAENASSKDVA